MQAQHIMTPQPFVVLPTEPVSRAAEIMRDLGVGSVPVVDDVEHRQLLGIITDRDIAVRCVAQHHDGPCTVESHMSRPPLDVVPLTASLDEVIARMEEERVRRVLVVGPDGSTLMGIIAQADLALRLGRSNPSRIEHLLTQLSVPGPVVRTDGLHAAAGW